MTESRILRLFQYFGWNDRNSTPMLIAMHVGIVAGAIAIAVLFQRTGAVAPPKFERISDQVRYQHTEVTPIDPSGMSRVSLGRRKKPLEVAWIGGSPMKVGPARDDFDNLARLVAVEISKVASSPIDFTSVMLQASAFGDTYVAAEYLLNQQPDVLVMEANAFWFGNDLVISRYPFLADDLAWRLRRLPQLWPLGLASVPPASAGIDAASAVFPPFASITRTGRFSAATAKQVDFIGMDVVESQLSASIPAGSLAAYWQRGIQDPALYWQQIGIDWRGRGSETLDGFQDGSEVSYALLIALLRSARAADIPVFLYVNPVDLSVDASDSAAYRFEAVRRKELTLLGLESQEGRKHVITTSQFLNGTFPAMTFRDENHVNNPGGMVELLANDLCGVFESVRRRSVECAVR